MAEGKPGESELAGFEENDQILPLEVLQDLDLSIPELEGYPPLYGGVEDLTILPDKVGGICLASLPLTRLLRRQSPLRGWLLGQELAEHLLLGRCRECSPVPTVRELAQGPHQGLHP